MALLQLQIGKNGLTQEFLSNLKARFVTAESARVSVLKSATRDKEKLKAWVAEMILFLGKNYRATIIGYTVVLRKLRRAVK